MPPRKDSTNWVMTNTDTPSTAAFTPGAPSAEAARCMPQYAPADASAQTADSIRQAMRMTMGVNHTVEAKAASMLRSSRSLTWRPAAMKASPEIAIITVANCVQRGAGAGWRPDIDSAGGIA